MSLINIDSEYKLVKSWNLTYKKKSLIYYPKEKKQFKQLLKHFNKSNTKFSIKTGECSYDGKSINSEKSSVTISLKNFDKIININKKNKTINVQAGAKIMDIVLILKEMNLTLSAVPGGEHITIGGAISANVIGKDSSKKIGSFGDNVKNITVMMHDGSVHRYKKNSKNFKLFVGSFGLFGIILEAKLILRKIKSQNLLLSTFKINRYSEIKKFLNIKTEFQYLQIDPFFRKNGLGIVFAAKFNENNKNLFRSKNFKINLIDIFLFKLSSLLLNLISWKIFYKFFIIFNTNKAREVDIHNFYYTSKYKHLVPHLCKNGLLDYEVLAKDNNLIKILIKIKKLILENQLYPIYIIVKKLYKSKSNYFYSFNDNGYSIAVSFDRNNLNNKIKYLIENFFIKNNLKVNICKTDTVLTSEFKKKIKKKIRFHSKNNFDSIFKLNLLNKIR